MPEIEFFQLTDVGCVRTNNEDAVGSWPHEDGLLFAVADGLGGYNAGEFASTLALEVLAREMERAPGTWAVGKRLRRAIQEANLEIYNKAITVPELGGMGTTITATTLIGASIVTAHVGDCRLYRLRDGGIDVLTRDHTMAQDLLQFHLISPEQATDHPGRHQLTRSVGGEPFLNADILTGKTLPGDTYLLCSDGLWSELTDGEIQDMLGENDISSACEKLVRIALGGGAPDNITAIVFRIEKIGTRATSKFSLKEFLYGR